MYSFCPRYVTLLRWLLLQAICFVTDCSHVAAASHAWREALQHLSDDDDDDDDDDASEGHLKFRYRTTGPGADNAVRRGKEGNAG